MRSTTKETGERVRQVGKAIGGLLASAILGATPALAGEAIATTQTVESAMAATDLLVLPPEPL